MYSINEIFIQSSRKTYPYTIHAELQNPSINVLNVLSIRKGTDNGFDPKVFPTYVIEFEMIDRYNKCWKYPQTPEGLLERDLEYDKIVNKI